MLLLFFAFLVAVYAWRSAAVIPWESGRVRVLVLELAPPDQVPGPALARFNGELPSAAATLPAAARWLSAQFASYCPRAGALTVEFVVSGPHRVAIDPPDLLDPDLTPLQRLGRSLRYYLMFRRLASSLGADFSDFDARLVVLLEQGRGNDVESASIADARQRFGVVHLDPEVPDPTYAVITLLHELGHTLGATDKYDEGSFLARWPEGFVEPRRDPMFPQRAGELMAVDIPLTRGTEREPASLGELAVGARTAAEMGWITAGAADREYEGLPPTPR